MQSCYTACAILHDAFRRFFNDYGQGSGYYYAASVKYKCFKQLPLVGQLGICISLLTFYWIINSPQTIACYVTE